MGIVLKILSVLGIILLSIIGLVLLILLIILLAPINYKARVVTKNGDIEANVKVGWMFFIRFLLDFKDKNLDYRLRLFGIKVFPKKEKPVKQKSESGSDEEASESTGENRVVMQSLDNAEAGMVKTEGIKTETVKAESESTDTVKTEAVNIETIKPSTEGIKPEVNKSTEAYAEGMAGETVKTSTTEEDASEEKPEKESIWVKLDKLVAKLKAVWDICVAEKLEIETFFKRKSTKYTLEVLKKAIFNIVNHIRPRKLNGRVEFGFDDPATTGYALAALGAFYGLYCDNLEVTPDFSGKTIDADVTVSGRIVLGYLVFVALSVYIRKKVRMFIRNVMALKDVSLENVEKIKEQFAKASAEA